MMKQPMVLLLLASLLWMTPACAARDAETPAPGDVSTAEMDQAEEKWNGQKVSGYRVEVLVVNSIWHAQSHKLVVENGAVVESSAACSPAPFEGKTCDVRPFDAEAYTVPGLFARAREQQQGQGAQWLKITFDPTYGFPSQISYDDPNVTDADWTWRVMEFEAAR
jgi:hypothetical protein